MLYTDLRIKHLSHLTHAHVMCMCMSMRTCTMKDMCRIAHTCTHLDECTVRSLYVEHAPFIGCTLCVVFLTINYLRKKTYEHVADDFRISPATSSPGISREKPYISCFVNTRLRATVATHPLSDISPPDMAMPELQGGVGDKHGTVTLARGTIGAGVRAYMLKLNAQRFSSGIMMWEHKPKI